MYPHEAVPDGAAFAPHHYIYGLLLVAALVAFVWDNYPTRYRLGVLGFALLALATPWRLGLIITPILKLQLRICIIIHKQRSCMPR